MKTYKLPLIFQSAQSNCGTDRKIFSFSIKRRKRIRKEDDEMTPLVIYGNVKTVKFVNK